MVDVATLQGKVGLRRAGGRSPLAEKRGVWVITKKEFFERSKNAVFWQFLKIASGRAFYSMNTGLLQVPHFSLWLQNGPKRGFKKISCQIYRRLQIWRFGLIGFSQIKNAKCKIKNENQKLRMTNDEWPMFTGRSADCMVRNGDLQNPRSNVHCRATAGKEGAEFEDLRLKTKNSESQLGENARPHPGPMASQARHEMVAPHTLCAPRNVVSQERVNVADDQGNGEGVLASAQSRVGLAEERQVKGPKSEYIGRRYCAAMRCLRLDGLVWSRWGKAPSRQTVSAQCRTVLAGTGAVSHRLSGWAAIGGSDAKLAER